MPPSGRQEDATRRPEPFHRPLELSGVRITVPEMLACSPKPFLLRLLRRRSPLRGAQATLLLVLSLSGCDRDKAEPPTGESALERQEKQEKLEALLRDNGVDPSQLPSGSPKDGTPPPQPTTPGSENAGPESEQALQGAKQASPAVATSRSESPGVDAITIEMLSTGNAPKKPLRYQFVAGRTRNFQLDIEVAVDRSIDGRPAPGVPALTLKVKGNNKTLSVENGVARRRATFTELVPTVSGVPPELLAQLQQQYAPLSGIQLIEAVDPRGTVLQVDFDQRAIQPQVLALMQQLQDGMTNAYLSLPAEAVGPGARWIAKTEMGAAGITLLQQSEVHFVSLEGSRGEFEMKLSQKAKSSKVSSTELPPGVEMEVSKVEGLGSGTMSVDFQELLVSSRIELVTETEVKVTEPGAPAPVVQSSTTSVKARVALTK